jgi:hypothetical protein
MNCNPKYCKYSKDGECTKEYCTFRKDNGYCSVFEVKCPFKGED